MSLLDKMFRRRQTEQRAVTHLNGIPKNWDEFGGSGHVSDHSAMQLIAVNACVRLLSDSISSLPIDAYRKQDGRRIELDPAPALVRDTFGGRLTQFEGFDQIVRSLATRGESLSVIGSFDALERAQSIIPIHPDDWTAERNRNGGGPIVYRVYGERIDTSEILHIKRFSIPGRIHALSPISAAAQGIGLGLSAERYGATWFRDSANPSAVLESDQDMTDDQVAITQRQWIDSYGGRRHPAVMTGGLKYRPITITPNESQFLETRKFQRSEIAMLFGIPPHMIGDTERSTSWGTGIEQQSIGFVRYTLRPWLTCIEAAMSNLLPRGQYFRFNVDGLLRGDLKSQSEAWQIGRNGGWLSVNEIRALQDMKPVAGGDTYIQPLNMGPLGTDPTQGEPDGPQI